MGAQMVGPPLAGETSFDACYRANRDRLIATVNAVTRCGADLATEAVDEAFVRARTAELAGTVEVLRWAPMWFWHHQDAWVLQRR